MFEWFKNLFSKVNSSVSSPIKKDMENQYKIGKEAIDLILEFEGVDQPSKRPPGDSGITLGFGFDGGYCTKEEFMDAWSKHLSKEELDLLSTAIGKKGQAAEAIKNRFRGITIKKEDAREVFDRCTVPKWIKQANRTFPGMEILSPNQQGVLVSIVFNRGTSLEGSRRTEMKNIANILKSNASKEDKVNKIVSQILSMQRVWPSDDPSTGHRGLRRRRRAEAALFAKG